VEFTSGGRDLLLTVAARDLAQLSDFVVRGLGSLPGIGSTRTHLVTHIHAYGGDWQIRALDSQQRSRLAPQRRRDTVPARTHTADERTMLAVLSRDGRAGLAELAEAMGCSASTAHRRFQAMVQDGLITFRCDLAQPLSGWPVSLWLWASVPPDRAAQTANGLAALPETRACMTLTGGTSNFLYCAWLRSLHDALRLEQQLVAAVRGLVVVDRAVALGFEKRMGQLLDRRGHRVGCVPIEL
jgi:DNA-binding Lrp family transcriptional regulator